MEGLSFNLGIEEDPDKDKEAKGKDKEAPKKRSILEELFLDKADKKEREDKEKEAKPEIAQEALELEVVDKAPELDAEAPIEHLSHAETEAVAQTLASERLSEMEVEEEEFSSERLAAESFLENIEASGDIEQAYNETLMELGEAAVDSIAEESFESETAPPVDPKSLVEAAKSELSPDTYYPIKEPEAEKSPKPEKPPAPKEEVEETKSVLGSVVDYLVGRRVGRMGTEHSEETIEKSLYDEVSQMKLGLFSREHHVRQLARHRSFEKKIKDKETEAETIGQVVIKGETLNKEKNKAEIAGISAYTMDQEQLVEKSKEIKVEGGNLKNIYDNHLIGEKGLRRVVAEYLRGGDYIETLKHELLEREKDFERDPKLRDQGVLDPLAPKGLGLDEMLAKTGIDWSEPQPSFSGEPKVKGRNLPALMRQLRSPARPGRLVDVILMSVILGMAIIIIVLIAFR